MEELKDKVESITVEDDERNVKSAEYEIHKTKEDSMIGIGIVAR